MIRQFVRDAGELGGKEEGFDAIYRVRLKNTGGFAVEAL